MPERPAPRPCPPPGRAAHRGRDPAAPGRRAVLAAGLPLAIALAGLPGVATAQPTATPVRIGVTLSTTGHAVSLGVPAKNTIALLPRTMGGLPVEYVILDDASDSSTAVANTRRLTSENHVDAIIGSSTTPNTLAMLDVLAEAQTPAITLASSARLIEPVDAKRRWMFKTPQNDTMMVLAILEHAASQGLKTMGYIGFADALGEAFYSEFDKLAAVRGIRIVASERYAPRDTSVTAQVLKIVAAKPDMVVIGASGTPAVLPAKALAERGYKGRLYVNHGVANNDFLRVGGKDVEGAYVPTSPVLVAAQLPANHPARAQGLAYTRRYEAAHGPASIAAFGAYTWNAGLLLADAIPVAAKAAKPGTTEFRVALRDALEAIHDHHDANGVVNMSPKDHLGLDQRARVIVRVVDGAWKLQPTP